MERLVLQAPPGELAAVTECVRTLCPDADAAALLAAQRQHNVDGFFVADLPGGGKARRPRVQRRGAAVAPRSAPP